MVNRRSYKISAFSCQQCGRCCQLADGLSNENEELRIIWAHVQDWTLLGGFYSIPSSIDKFIKDMKQFNRIADEISKKIWDIVNNANLNDDQEKLELLIELARESEVEIRGDRLQDIEFIVHCPFLQWNVKNNRRFAFCLLHDLNLKPSSCQEYQPGGELCPL
ncbi:MAG: hypothetical protein ACFFCZ_23210 [Promethearchaeota archaeon]